MQIYSTARVPAEYFVHSIDNARKKEIKKQMEQKIGNPLIKIQYF
ncbi:MAG: hypothetical protein ACOC44_09665 [Promethearchaeia archaeon]